MQKIEYKKSGIHIIFEFDKISNYYLDQNNNICYIDKNKLLKEWKLCKDAKLKGVFIEKFKSLSDQEVRILQKKMDLEIDLLYNKNKHLDFKCNAYLSALLKRV